jgi:hypothetical protein
MSAPGRRAHRARAVSVATTIALFGVGVAMVAIEEWSAAVVNFAVAFVLFTSLRASDASYVYGWMSGRHAMLSSMIEAQDRGMNMAEWVTTEAERDAALIAQRRGLWKGPPDG